MVLSQSPAPSTQPRGWFVLYAQPEDDSAGIKEGADEQAAAANAAANEKQRAVKRSLEEKMKSWEASPDDDTAVSKSWAASKLEIRETMSKAPDAQRSGAFDLGLYIAFPLMVISGLMVAFFPLLLDSIDTTSVGPPPTM